MDHTVNNSLGTVFLFTLSVIKMGSQHASVHSGRFSLARVLKLAPWLVPVEMAVVVQGSVHSSP